MTDLVFATLDGSEKMVGQDAIEALRASLRGELIVAGDPAYDARRALYNGMIDRRPALILRCMDAADVMAAVDFARRTGVLIAVRGGGHNGGGLGSCDGGLVIDLSLMKGVRVDPALRTVRAGAGCTQGDLDHATHAFGLAVPSGIVSSTGIGGLTLGGGHGYLSRAHGLTIDNLLEADVVLADGSIATASEEENPELFWAIRGGGGNFGIVTSFLYRGHPVAKVYAGPIFYDRGDARAIMQWYRDWLPTSPEKLCCFLGLKKVPSCAPFPEALWGRSICALISCYVGPEDDGIAAMQPVRDALPGPLMDAMSMMPFPALQAMFDPLMPSGLQWYWKGDFVHDLSDAAIDAHLQEMAEAPGTLSLMHLYPIDGAVHRVPADATAWNMRDATWSMVICGIDPDPAQADALKKWCRRYWNALRPFNRGGAYVNFMMDDEGSERVRATYGENFGRLARAKARYDPDNMFRVNQNVPPGA